MINKLTLHKNERLKSRKLIEQLFSEGKKFTASPFRIFYLYNEVKKTGLQFGVGVSSKNFKKAVDRNRIKRLIKESYRLQKAALQHEVKDKAGELSIFIIYTGRELPLYNDVYTAIEKVLEKLIVIINKPA